MTTPERPDFISATHQDHLGHTRAEQEKGRGTLQTSALPLGYGAGRNVRSQVTTRSARVRGRAVSPESHVVAIMVAVPWARYHRAPLASLKPPLVRCERVHSVVEARSLRHSCERRIVRHEPQRALAD